MNPDLLKYINSEKHHPLTIRIWLDCLIFAVKNGTSNIVYKDVIIKYRITLPQLHQLFNPLEAQKLDLIKILVKTDTFISINIKNKLVKIPEPKAKKEPKSHTTQRPETKTTDIALPIALDQTGLIIGSLSKTYGVTVNLRRSLIGDYCEFYKGLIVLRASLVGNVIANPANPKLNKQDPAAFDEMAIYLKDNGFNSEQAIRHALQQIYKNWHYMPENIQNYFTPAQMNRNFSSIYMQMIQIGKKTNSKTKKDEQLTEKLNGAEQKDYSHMVKPQ